MKNNPSLRTNLQTDIKLGLIGSGIQESRSPRMHMDEASAQGFRLNYQLFDLDIMDKAQRSLDKLLDAIESSGYAGINITHPCKQTVIEYLDKLSPDAQDLGAVNTVLFKDGKRYGHNTDWQGFHLSFSKILPHIKKDTVFQLGVGGAGSAVAYALAKADVRTIYLYDLDKKKIELLIKSLAPVFKNITFEYTDNIETAIKIADGIINTTPVGMKKYPGLPIPAKLLSSRHWLADVIYFPLETELLKLARNKGCKTLDGSGMAINQAAEAFKLFTGKQANAERMAQTFFNAFG